MELAKAAGVPPYVVFHDATLREMTLFKPTTLAQLAQLPGIGEKKLERYGERFLELLRSTAHERRERFIRSDFIPRPRPDQKRDSRAGTFVARANKSKETFTKLLHLARKC